MTDARLHADTFITHQKVDQLSDAAYRVYVNGICWSVAHGTDGHLPTSRLRLLRPKPVNKAVVYELTDGGLWDVVEGGWQIHDFLEYQTSAAELKKQKQDNVQRQRAYRLREKADLERLRAAVSAGVSATVESPAVTRYMTPNITAHVGKARQGAYDGGEVRTEVDLESWTVSVGGEA